MKRVRDNSASPMGGSFVFINPEDGYRIAWHDYRVCKSEAKKYRQINNYPIGLLWDEQFEENICANTPGEPCEEFTPPTFLEKMDALARALYRSAQGGFKVVSAEQLEARKNICKGCNFYAGSTSILKVACSKCGCSGLKLSLQSSKCPAGKW